MVFLLVLTVLSIFFTGNSLTLYIDTISFILAIILPYIIISFIYTPKEQMRFKGEIFKPAGLGDKKELSKALLYFKSFKKLLLASAVVWTIVGFIGIMANLEDRESLGPNFGVLIIVPLYVSLFILMVVEPLRASAEKNLNE